MIEELRHLGRRLSARERLSKPFDRGVGTAYCRLRQVVESEAPTHTVMNGLVAGEGSEVHYTWNTRQPRTGRMPTALERITAATNECNDTYGEPATTEAMEMIIAEVEANYHPQWGINARQWETIDAR